MCHSSLPYVYLGKQRNATVGYRRERLKIDDESAHEHLLENMGSGHSQRARCKIKSFSISGSFVMVYKILATDILNL